MRSRRMTPKERAKGALHLSDVAQVTLVLESKATVVFTPDDEMAIPTDPAEMRQAALRAPAQLAFWSYQTERALRDVRQTEYELTKVEGEMSLVYRQWFLSQKNTYTEDMVRSRVSVDAKVDALRNQLLTVREIYGIIRATRDSVEHRCYVLRKIIGPESN